MSVHADSTSRNGHPLQWNHDLDALIERFGRESDDRKANALLDDIFRRFGVEAIRRSVERGAGRSRCFDDAEDLIGEVSLSLVERLRRFRDKQCSKVDCFRAYTESVTRNAIHSRSQRERPLRTKLIANLRYAVSSSPRLHSWKNEAGVTLIGLMDGPSAQAAGTLIARLLEDPRSLPVLLRLDDAFSSFDLRTIVTRLIEAIGGPAPFYSVVNVIAGARELADGRPVAESQFDAGPFYDRMVDTAPDAERTAIAQQELRALWNSIQDLPMLQRAALILNLRDPLGRGVIALLLETKIATRSQIAQAVGMSLDELLTRWDDLPMDDRSIAHRYGVTPVQVVSLRRAARTRLLRGPVQTIVLKPSRRRAAA